MNRPLHDHHCSYIKNIANQCDCHVSREGSPPNRTRVPELMAEAAETFRQRNALYGNSYMDFNNLAMALFPEGLKIETAEEWNRFGVLFFCIGKLQRYCKNFKNGGHKDSAHDLGVYSFMLEDLTHGD